MAIFGHAFHSIVARRVVLLFVGCTMIPLSGLALLTLERTTSEIDAEARTRLHRDVKALAMDGVERLSLLESRLRLVGLAVLARSGSPEDVVDRVFGDRTATIGFAPDDEEWHILRGSAAAEANRPLAMPKVHLTDAQVAHLEQAGAVIVRSPATTPGHAPAHWMLVHARIEGRGGIAMAAIDHRTLWGIAGSLLPSSSSLCVYEDELPIVCSEDVAPAVTQLAARVPPNVERLVQAAPGAEEMLVRTWSVPLKHAYLSPSWVLALMRPQEAVRAPLARFTRDFWLVMLLSLLIVILLSVGQVRRSFQPLAELTAATERLSRREFDTHTSVRSGDEFEVLGDAINVLADHLKRQFEELEAFNLGTLAALARAIDAKSPWTRGHSERVTALAVDIAREMGLSTRDVTDLQRGGLVHDIGKLATPSDILDKTGPLSDDERRIIELHPLRGARILEPIPAYERLLPIVAEHHERWDGTGYPRGLKGTEIALTARILAVADAFDAIRSDRPYRAGRSLADSVSILAARSGELFDPEVIDAFRRVAARMANPPNSTHEAIDNRSIA